jgi:CHAT domain-containing protein
MMRFLLLAGLAILLPTTLLWYGGEAPSEKPFAHPYYWSAFILIGDPN